MKSHYAIALYEFNKPRVDALLEMCEDLESLKETGGSRGWKALYAMIITFQLCQNTFYLKSVLIMMLTSISSYFFSGIEHSSWSRRRRKNLDVFIF
jgi:hypothetical protein